MYLVFLLNRNRWKLYLNTDRVNSFFKKTSHTNIDSQKSIYMKVSSYLYPRGGPRPNIINWKAWVVYQVDSSTFSVEVAINRQNIKNVMQ